MLRHLSNDAKMIWELTTRVETSHVRSRLSIYDLIPCHHHCECFCPTWTTTHPYTSVSMSLVFGSILSYTTNAAESHCHVQFKRTIFCNWCYLLIKWSLVNIHSHFLQHPWRNFAHCQKTKKIEIGIHEYMHTCLVRELSLDIFGRWTWSYCKWDTMTV